LIKCKKTYNFTWINELTFSPKIDIEKMVIQKVEQDGIVFIDEIDKIAKPEVFFLIFIILISHLGSDGLW